MKKRPPNRHKRPVTAIAVCFALFAAMLLPAALNAQALSKPNQDPADYLTQTLGALGITPDGDYEVRDLYSLELEHNGYEYTFTSGGEAGYAIMIFFRTQNGDLYHDITEMFFGSASPFSSAAGTPVYLDKFAYFDYSDGTFADLTTGATLTYAQAAAIADNTTVYGDYSDGGTPKSEKIYYSRRSLDSYEMEYGLPGYCGSYHTNSCANIAGGNVLGYYDIFYPDLIPNFETTYMVGDKRMYYFEPDEVTEIISNDLYYAMETNVNNGTTFEGFKNGLRSYVQDKGYDINYYDIASDEQLDVDSYLLSMYLGHPVAVFMSSYNTSLGAFVNNDGHDDVSIAYYVSNHVMAGEGYEEIEYYNESGVMFRKDAYLMINSGSPWTNHGYMRIHDNEVFEHAIEIEIY